MKRKLMLIVPMLHQGGFERVCVATARLLEPYFEIYIVLFSSADIAYDIHGLHVIDLRMGSVPSKIGKIRNVFRRSRKVRRLKEELGVSIAYSFGPTANLVNVFSRWREHAWCGVRSYMDMNKPSLLKLFSKRADLVVCCSRIIERQMREQLGCGNLETLYNPFDIEHIREQASQPEAKLPFTEGELVIVSMGRQDDVKGFWHLVKSFALVHSKLPAARLLIVGEGDFHEYWQLAEGLGVEDAVCFPGVKKNPFPWLAQGKIYVMTSINEGFPNVLVEAMALGIPVISTNCMTGPAEILTDNFEKYIETDVYQDADYGILIPRLKEEKNLEPSVITEEEERLAEQMLRLLTQKELYDHYSAAALTRAAQFSDASYVEKILEMASEDIIAAKGEQ